MIKKNLLKKPSKTFIGAPGWICPVCGAGNSPYTPTCPCRNSFPVHPPHIPYVPGPPYQPDPHDTPYTPWYYDRGPTCYGPGIILRQF